MGSSILDALHEESIAYTERYELLPSATSARPTAVSIGARTLGSTQSGLVVAQNWAQSQGIGNVAFVNASLRTASPQTSSVAVICFMPKRRNSSSASVLFGVR